MKYAIGRPRNGISLNGNEWLLDEHDKLITFDTWDEAIVYVKDKIVKVDPEEYVFSIASDDGQQDFPIALSDALDEVGDYSTSAGKEQDYFEKLQNIKRIIGYVIDSTGPGYRTAVVEIDKLLKDIPNGTG
ncbi:MAG: hypothetical protein HOG49_41890 [Candidatus Scalindua sp.]|jgi:hypothetical protein|nr:hypothetical protein [Candidatus Scalindua sp.]